MLEIVARESRPCTLQLTEEQAELLARLGRGLASSKSWWGAQEIESGGTVIHLTRLGHSSWNVLFRDVVGVVSAGETQIRVVPKIPESHFNFLASHSTLAPRLAAEQVLVDHHTHFVELLARWFVQAAETLLNFGLRRDYSERTEELSVVEGKLDVLATTLEGAKGRPVAVCEFDELCEDTPLNRMIKAAARLVAGLRVVSKEIRVRARRLVFRMPFTGALLHSDLRVESDRLTRQYGPGLALGKVLIEGGGVSDRVGTLHGTAFLVRTPDIIESGLRTVLSRLLPQHQISKKGLVLGDSGLSINPDLVFDEGLAVGDVKYRYLGRDWDRGHFNQAVTFATGFQAKKCAVIGFADDSAVLPRQVTIGDVTARAFAWRALEAWGPRSSAEELATEVEEWLSPLGIIA